MTEQPDDLWLTTCTCNDPKRVCPVHAALPGEHQVLDSYMAIMADAWQDGYRAGLVAANKAEKQRP